MSTQPPTLGVCPRCETAIPSSRLLIEYDGENGRERFAECPSCGDVIHPA